MNFCMSSECLSRKALVCSLVFTLLKVRIATSESTTRLINFGHARYSPSVLSYKSLNTCARTPVSFNIPSLKRAVSTSPFPLCAAALPSLITIWLAIPRTFSGVASRFYSRNRSRIATPISRSGFSVSDFRCKCRIWFLRLLIYGGETLIVLASSVSVVRQLSSDSWDPLRFITFNLVISGRRSQVSIN